MTGEQSLIMSMAMSPSSPNITYSISVLPRVWLAMLFSLSSSVLTLILQLFLLFFSGANKRQKIEQHLFRFHLKELDYKKIRVRDIFLALPLGKLFTFGNH